MKEYRLAVKNTIPSQQLLLPAGQTPAANHIYSVELSYPDMIAADLETIKRYLGTIHIWHKPGEL